MNTTGGCGVDHVLPLLMVIAQEVLHALLGAWAAPDVLVDSSAHRRHAHVKDAELGVECQVGGCLKGNFR